MTRRRLFVVALGALALALALGLFRSRSGAAHAQSGADGRGVAQAESRPSRPAPPRAGEGRGSAAQVVPGELPASLAGTEVDGALEAGPDGHLSVGPRVIALFDHFLSATGEEDEAMIRARIEAHARAHLTEPALGEALDLLDAYMGYRAAGRKLALPADATAAERLAAVRELRREHFGEDAQALFGEDERAAEVAIAKSEIVNDPSLSPEEREDRLAGADRLLPAQARDAQAKATSVMDLRSDEAALREDGADEDVIRRYRESKLGAGAADRLGALDRDRATFKARIEAFRRERDQRCGALSDPSSCERDLLERSFDERERIRVRVIVGMQ